MRVFTLLVAGLFAGSLTAADDKKESKKKDEEAILGTWKLENTDYGEPLKPLPFEDSESSMTFEKGGKLGMKSRFRGASEGTFTLDASAKTMETKCEYLTTAYFYDLDGDTLRVCWQLKFTEPPTELKAIKAKQFVMTYKRVREGKSEDTAFVETIAGTWRVEKMDAGGSPVPPGDEIEKMRFAFYPTGRVVTTDGAGKTEQGEYNYDLSPKVRQLNIRMDKSARLGIVEVDRDTLRFCYGVSIDARPTEFKGVKDKQVIMTLKRVKDEKKEEKKEKKDEPKKDK